ncbi:MAG TPA: hypothetical protein VHL11_06875, partial [Phototrophicaceae bacterium]|nr:hypothetical protein [Phototrophicaceae bacterium]
LAGHVKETLQLIPFGLCFLGFLAVTAVLLRPQRLTILVLRITMVGVAAGSLLGMYLHLKTNLDFELEIRPNAAIGDVLMEALKGASPLLAPGILALVAVLAIAATYYHPALTSGTDSAKS